LLAFPGKKKSVRPHRSGGKGVRKDMKLERAK
jgi:hypothetical protein